MTTLDTASFDFTRTFTLAPAKLWELLTDPTHREQWGAPEPGMVLTVEASDLVEGGADRHRCGPAEAPDFVVDTRWYRIEAPARAVFTETIIIGDEAMATSLVTYALSETSGGTELAVNVAVSSFTGPEASGEFKGGWEAGLENLVRYAAGVGADA